MQYCMRAIAIPGCKSERLQSIVSVAGRGQVCERNQVWKRRGNYRPTHCPLVGRLFVWIDITACNLKCPLFGN